MARGVSAGLSPTEGRKFGLAVGGAFLLLGVLLWWRGHTVADIIAWALASILIVGGLAVPARLGPIYRGWMALARAISTVTTPIFMGAIFFLVLTPAGLLVRLFGHRPLVRRRGAETFWQTRAAEARQSSMDHQF